MSGNLPKSLLQKTSTLKKDENPISSTSNITVIKWEFSLCRVTAKSITEKTIKNTEIPKGH